MASALRLVFSSARVAGALPCVQASGFCDLEVPTLLDFDLVLNGSSYLFDTECHDDIQNVVNIISAPACIYGQSPRGVTYPSACCLDASGPFCMGSTGSSGLMHGLFSLNASSCCLYSTRATRRDVAVAGPFVNALDLGLMPYIALQSLESWGAFGGLGRFTLLPLCKNAHLHSLSPSSGNSAAGTVSESACQAIVWASYNGCSMAGSQEEWARGSADALSDPGRKSEYTPGRTLGWQLGDPATYIYLQSDTLAFQLPSQATLAEWSNCTFMSRPIPRSNPVHAFTILAFLRFASVCLLVLAFLVAFLDCVHLLPAGQPRMPLADCSCDLVPMSQSSMHYGIVSTYYGIRQICARLLSLAFELPGHDSPARGSRITCVSFFVDGRP